MKKKTINFLYADFFWNQEDALKIFPQKYKYKNIKFRYTQFPFLFETNTNSILNQQLLLENHCCFINSSPLQYIAFNGATTKFAEKKKITHLQFIWHFIFKDALVEKFINCLTTNGKKEKAEKILFTCFSILKQKIHNQPIYVFHRAIQNILPVLEVKSTLQSGKTQWIPKEIPLKRQVRIAIMNLLIATKKDKRNIPFSNKLAEQILLAYHQKGDAYADMIRMHRKAYENRMNIHYNVSKKKRT